MASRAIFKSVAAQNRRSDDRLRATVARASVRGMKRQADPAMLDDISIYGCRLACDAAFELGATVWVRLAGSLPIAARVVWCEQGLVGCRFNEPIDRALLRTMTLVAA